MTATPNGAHAPRIRVGYTESAVGEIHFRHLGQGRPRILLHWAPASGRMYEAAMPSLASTGFAVFALDLPGYGRSHKMRPGASVPATAEELLAALEVLGIDRFDLLGGHLSASVAIEMQHQARRRVRSLVLDGLLNLQGEEWTALLRRFQGYSPMPDAQGRFRSFPFDMVVETLQEWNPRFELTAVTLNEVYELLDDYLEMGLPAMRAFVEPGTGPAPPPYALPKRLADVSCPTLVLTAALEPLRAAYTRSVQAIPGARGHDFPGVHPLLSGRHAEWAQIVARFLAET
jgi:pimeloyl-ACP methyl ester carboxylesterase